MGRKMVVRLRLGLLLLALLLPMKSTSAAPNPANATTKVAGGAPQSRASLLAISLSLLHLYCKETRDKKRIPSPSLNPIQVASRSPVWQGKSRSSSNLLILHLILLTQKMLGIPNVISWKNK
ncbi:PREDICTED: signal transducer CD24-like [Galeopterus variegatus]|uniref:Signal transducer CD24-like n=1 Tax=Galeopterus variegatus TaxID=482537 RepID=A0ABM0S040_GALVR|nr:PREDICTED: signal transducer CD24-like [Galeopterus variegatus]